MIKNAKDITFIHKIINKHIYKQELKLAFDHIRSLVLETQDWELIEGLNNLETSYRYMLQYFIDGAPDPKRDEVYKTIQANAYELTDNVAFLLMSQFSNNVFFEEKKINQSINFSGLVKDLTEVHEEIALTELLDEDESKKEKLKAFTIRQDALLSTIFNKIWTSGRLNDAELSTWEQLIKNNTLDTEDKAQIISALFLNLIQQFDEKKLLFLFDYYDDKEENVQQRALIVIMLILYLFDKRIPLYHRINVRLEHLKESATFRKNVRNIILQFIRSKETEKIARKMNDEILPEMMKAGSIIRDKLTSDDLNDPSSWEDKNPEWQEIFEDSGFSDKMQEFANLQMEGADVFMSTFANLKSFPFFSILNHWLLPFNKKFAAIYDDKLQQNELPEFLDLIMQSPFLCNSDKYSFCFSVMQMPVNYRNMSISQFKMETTEMQKIEKEEALLSASKKAENVSKQYIQDLYRFFKLYPRRGNFVDIFSLPLNFYQTSTLKSIVSDEESLRMIAELYFNKNFFREAESLFSQLTQENSADNELYEKMGYCRQMLSNFEGALDAYLQSDIIKPDKPWTLRRIALCYRKMKNPEKAMEYYLRLEKLAPDNLNIQLNIGHCLFEQRKFEEALKYYFKVEYLDEKGKKALRPIAWTSFLCRNFTQAKKYYDIILDDNPTPQDIMNAGHVELLRNNRKDAIRFYSQSTMHKDSNEILFKSDFEKDTPDLIDAGLSEDILPLIMDEVFYNVQQTNE